jgi:hypothetical protein
MSVKTKTPSPMANCKESSISEDLLEEEPIVDNITPIFMSNQVTVTPTTPTTCNVVNVLPKNNQPRNILTINDADRNIMCNGIGTLNASA